LILIVLDTIDIMKSPKNKLQEYCQKNKFDLPKYSTIKYNGITGRNELPLLWETTLKVNNLIYNIKGTNIKNNELKLAEQACNEIPNINNKIEKIERKQKVQDIYSINLEKYKRILLVDGENCDININNTMEEEFEFLILIFVAKNTSKNQVFELQMDYKNCYVFISECVGKDAADFLLTFNAGILHSLNKNNTGAKYFILTKDHYGEFLEKFMNNCKFICSLDELN